MTVLFENKYDCCGCTACKSICPQYAISMKTDKEGFLYPDIELDLCIECNRCKEICSFQKQCIATSITIQDAYAIKHRNLKVRMKSRSGGMFMAISNYIMDNDGVVFGAGYGDDFRVCHKRAVSRIELNELQGSKYVQSDLGDTFLQVKKDLLENKWVLFTGTTCQVAGLRGYLGCDFDKLILCDIVCLGTPSPKIWSMYLSYMVSKYKGVVNKVNFRNKEKFGWDNHYETLTIDDKEYDSDIYATLFRKHYAYRPSCYNCKYTNLSRPSDITLADFWGINEHFPDFNDNRGVSLVFLNSSKARILFEHLKSDIDYKMCTKIEFVHPNFKEPATEPYDNASFWNELNNYGFGFIAQKYARHSRKVRIKILIKKVLNKFGLLNSIKTIMKKR